MAFYTIQTGFSRGEISPQFYDRQDFEGWNNALAKARNVLITASAIEVRAGLLYIDTITGTTEQNYKLVKLQFSDDLIFYAVFRDLAIDFYRFPDDDFVQTIVTTITSAEIPAMKLTFFDLSLLITRAANTPEVINYIAANEPTPFVKVDYSYSVQPQYDFDPTAYSSDTFVLSGGRKTGETGTLTRTVGSFTFDANYVGGQLTAIGTDQINFAGTARITAFTATTITLRITATIGDDQAVLPLTLAGEDILLTEKAFNATFGFPKLVGGFQNRVLFCSTPDVPTAFWASETGDPSSFDVGQGQDSNAITFTLNEDGVTSILHVVNNQTIQFVTNNGLYVFDTSFVGGLTPSNVNIVSTNKYNYSSLFQPIVYDSMTIGLIEGGQTLIGTQTTDNQTYESLNLTTMSTSLVNYPTDACNFDGQVENLSTMAFFVNSDGTLLQYQSLQQEGINGFSLSTTGTDAGDEYKNCLNVDNTVYFLVTRGDLVALERMDFDLRLDSTVVQIDEVTPFTVVTGLGHLEGRTVSIIVTDFDTNNGTIHIDGDVIMPSRPVVGGEVELDYPVGKATVGLFYAPEISPLEPAVPSQAGSSFYQRKRRYQIKVSYFESLGVEIEDATGTIWTQPTLQFGTAAFLAPPLTTDVIDFQINEGWRERLDTFTITQSVPFPFTIKGITQFIDIEDEI